MRRRRASTPPPPDAAAKRRYFTMVPPALSEPHPPSGPGLTLGAQYFRFGPFTDGDVEICVAREAQALAPTAADPDSSSSAARHLPPRRHPPTPPPEAAAGAIPAPNPPPAAPPASIFVPVHLILLASSSRYFAALLKRWTNTPSLGQGGGQMPTTSPGLSCEGGASAAAPGRTLVRMVVPEAQDVPAAIALLRCLYTGKITIADEGGYDHSSMPYASSLAAAAAAAADAAADGESAPPEPPELRRHRAAAAAAAAAEASSGQKAPRRRHRPAASGPRSHEWQELALRVFCLADQYQVPPVVAAAAAGFSSLEPRRLSPAVARALLWLPESRVRQPAAAPIVELALESVWTRFKDVEAVLRDPDLLRDWRTLPLIAVERVLSDDRTISRGEDAMLAAADAWARGPAGRASGALARRQLARSVRLPLLTGGFLAAAARRCAWFRAGAMPLLHLELLAEYCGAAVVPPEAPSPEGGEAGDAEGMAVDGGGAKKEEGEEEGEVVSGGGGARAAIPPPPPGLAEAGGWRSRPRPRDYSPPHDDDGTFFDLGGRNLTPVHLANRLNPTGRAAARRRPGMAAAVRPRAAPERAAPAPAAPRPAPSPAERRMLAIARWAFISRYPPNWMPPALQQAPEPAPAAAAEAAAAAAHGGGGGVVLGRRAATAPPATTAAATAATGGFRNVPEHLRQHQLHPATAEAMAAAGAAFWQPGPPGPMPRPREPIPIAMIIPLEPTGVPDADEAADRAMFERQQNDEQIPPLVPASPPSPEQQDEQQAALDGGPPLRAPWAYVLRSCYMWCPPGAEDRSDDDDSSDGGGGSDGSDDDGGDGNGNGGNMTRPAAPRPTRRRPSGRGGGGKQDPPPLAEAPFTLGALRRAYEAAVAAAAVPYDGPAVDPGAAADPGAVPAGDDAERLMVVREIEGAARETVAGGHTWRLSPVVRVRRPAPRQPNCATEAAAVAAPWGLAVRLLGLPLIGERAWRHLGDLEEGPEPDMDDAVEEMEMEEEDEGEDEEGQRWRHEHSSGGGSGSGGAGCSADLAAAATSPPSAHMLRRREDARRLALLEAIGAVKAAAAETHTRRSRGGFGGNSPGGGPAAAAAGGAAAATIPAGMGELADAACFNVELLTRYGKLLEVPGPTYKGAAVGGPYLMRWPPGPRGWGDGGGGGGGVDGGGGSGGATAAAATTTGLPARWRHAAAAFVNPIGHDDSKGELALRSGRIHFVAPGTARPMSGAEAAAVAAADDAAAAVPGASRLPAMPLRGWDPALWSAATEGTGCVIARWSALTMGLDLGMF